jgi:hypothetical protein
MSIQWKTYRTRFLVRARKLRSNLTFTDPLGRQHSGRRGDYLVQSSEGIVSITPRKIFEDIYVAMPADFATQSSKCKFARKQAVLPLDFAIAASIETLPTRKAPSRFNDARQPDSSGIARARRKSPQPVRPTSSRLGLM